MRSNYKKLGNYIELVSCLNNKLQYGETDVREVSNNKEIIQTRANNEGRDFNIFYVVKPEEFIYNSRTSRMGDKVGLGYNDTKRTFITSFNNTVFRVKDEALLPMYLYMWFNRPEFDRYVRFHSWGSSTEIFSWEEMCNTLLPVPSIDKQCEIVKEYNVIQNRIALNQQLIQKLEETAQAIYKAWFVEFEFPDENGQPYKSNGREMVWCEELGKEIPEGWFYKTLGNISTIKAGGDKPKIFSSFITDTLQVPIYSNSSENEGLFGYTDKPIIQKESITISARGAIIGYTVLRTSPFVPIVRLIVVIPENKNQLNYLYETIRKFAYEGSGSAQGQLTIPDISAYKIIIPNAKLLQSYQKISQIVTKNIEIHSQENQKLKSLKDLLLSRLATVSES